MKGENSRRLADATCTRANVLIEPHAAAEKNFALRPPAPIRSLHRASLKIGYSRYEKTQIRA